MRQLAAAAIVVTAPASFNSSSPANSNLRPAEYKKRLKTEP